MGEAREVHALISFLLSKQLIVHMCVSRIPAYQYIILWNFVNVHTQSSLWTYIVCGTCEGFVQCSTTIARGLRNLIIVGLIVETLASLIELLLLYYSWALMSVSGSLRTLALVSRKPSPFCIKFDSAHNYATNIETQIIRTLYLPDILQYKLGMQHLLFL